MSDEEIIPEPEPLRDGFSRHLVSEFEAYNAQATARIIAATGDHTITSYTYSIPDFDPLYCWVREEKIFTDLMTPEEYQTLVSKEIAEPNMDLSNGT